MLVSAKLADSSIDMAFQSLLRHMLDKSRPDKLKADTGEEEIQESEMHRTNVHNNLNYISYCGIKDVRFFLLLATY